MRIIFLICCYVPSSSFRHYSLSIKGQKDSPKISLRCHRQKHYWQLLTKSHVSIIGIKIPILEWIIFSEDCSWNAMKKDCSAEGLKLTGTPWHTLHPHDHSDKKFPFFVQAEKSPAM